MGGSSILGERTMINPNRQEPGGGIGQLADGLPCVCERAGRLANAPADISVNKSIGTKLGHLFEQDNGRTGLVGAGREQDFSGVPRRIPLER